MLDPFYRYSRELSWPLIRLTVGGILFVHGVNKLMTVTVAAVAARTFASRGIEPAMAFAYFILFLETFGSACLVLGLFTRFFAAAIAIELAVITFIVMWPHGFGFASPGGGWEFTFFWGLITFAVALRGGGPYSLDRKIGWEL